MSIFFVTMSMQNGEEGRPEGINNQEPPRNIEHHSEGSYATQVLETTRNLIMELHIFKADNEKIKKAQEDQQEINEMVFEASEQKRAQRIMKWTRKLVKISQMTLAMEQKKKTTLLMT